MIRYMVKQTRAQNEELHAMSVAMCEILQTNMENDKIFSEVMKEMVANNFFIAQCGHCTVSALRAYVVSIINTAIAHEQYEEAQKCKLLLSAIDELIDYQIQKES